MIKKIIFLLFLSSAFVFSSCSFGSGRRLVSSEDKKADARIEQILEAIKAKDEGAIKALFSKQALVEIDDFDYGVDYLFDFFQGDVESWKRDKWSSDESIEKGKKSVMLRYWYTVSTNKEKYMFFVIDFTEDTINSNNAGLYTLRVIKAEDRDTQFTYWQDMNIAGIYKPKDNEKTGTTPAINP
ncbi:DUF5104 domain-containing protein [Oceanirhabdus sp. W0125-5]|uniref:DUF5104 domain-containing protein n=1 Tax=Oceanirhabdus sp. W0125-5 TaxID=2999116 RepID=UPI0022F2AFDC|nr:DUF5104 domain-containing protein [Oceanirhabdus sp. W0125-5]WBW98158.1 DUF5104 domain-containing protein [Oceanirhabdus sp. W0125-5]